MDFFPPPLGSPKRTYMHTRSLIQHKRSVGTEGGKTVGWTKKKSVASERIEEEGRRRFEKILKILSPP